jgi:hypothetical protein
MNPEVEKGSEKRMKMMETGVVKVSLLGVGSKKTI